MVIAHHHARIPGQFRRKSACPDPRRQPQVQHRIRALEQLPAGERQPEEHQEGNREPSRHARTRPDGVRCTPRQDRAQNEREAPADSRARQPRHGVEHKVRDQAPKRKTDHEALGQRPAFVGLPQRHPHHDVADGSQRRELRRQKQEARDHRRINSHSSTFTRGAGFTSVGHILVGADAAPAVTH